MFNVAGGVYTRNVEQTQRCSSTIYSAGRKIESQLGQSSGCWLVSP